MAVDVHEVCTDQVGGDQGPKTASEGINVSHHSCRVVHNMKEVAKKFLCPAANLVDGTVVFQNFLDATAVAKPIELGTPQVFSVMSNGPPTNGGLANEGVVVLLLIGASSGAKADWVKASTLQG